MDVRRLHLRRRHRCREEGERRGHRDRGGRPEGAVELGPVEQRAAARESLADAIAWLGLAPGRLRHLHRAVATPTPPVSPPRRSSPPASRGRRPKAATWIEDLRVTQRGRPHHGATSAGDLGAIAYDKAAFDARQVPRDHARRPLRVASLDRAGRAGARPAVVSAGSVAVDRLVGVRRCEARVLLAAAPLLLSIGVALPVTAPAPAYAAGSRCAPGTGVTVVVDYGALGGGIQLGCDPRRRRQERGVGDERGGHRLGVHPGPAVRVPHRGQAQHQPGVLPGHAPGGRLLGAVLVRRHARLDLRHPGRLVAVGPRGRLHRLALPEQLDEDEAGCRADRGRRPSRSRSPKPSPARSPRPEPSPSRRRARPPSPSSSARRGRPRPSGEPSGEADEAAPRRRSARRRGPCRREGRQGREGGKGDKDRKDDRRRTRATGRSRPRSRS